MTKSFTEKKLEEFDKKFGSSNDGAMPSGIETANKIKDFLSKSIEQAREEERERIKNTVNGLIKLLKLKGTERHAEILFEEFLSSLNNQDK